MSCRTIRRRAATARAATCRRARAATARRLPTARSRAAPSCRANRAAFPPTRTRAAPPAPAARRRRPESPTSSSAATSSAARCGSSAWKKNARRRALVHEPLQREGNRADHEQRGPGEIVVAEAVEHQAAHPGAEERADLVRQEGKPEEHVE